MKLPIIILLILCMQGCGTVTTLSETDQRIASNLTKQETYCESISRVYSGVAYDLCKLNSKPTGTEVDILVGFYMVDGLLSAVSDTVALPYTIYQQYDKGSIQIEQ